MRSRQNKFHNLVMAYWQPTVFYGMLIVFFGLLLWFRLGNLVGGYSPSELHTLQVSNGFRHILNNPIDAPFTIVAHLLGLMHIGGSHNLLLPLRVTAALFGLLVLTTFYWLVRHWHGERSAILGTTMFGCSAWFLHASRLGTPDVLLFLLLGLAACIVWLKRTDNPLVMLVGFAFTAGLLYIPGMVWLLVIGAIWQGKTIIRLFKEHTSLMGLGSIGLLVLISPLAWAIYMSPDTAKVIAGLPGEGWPQVTAVLQRLVHIPLNLLIRGPLEPEHWLGRLPILDAFSIVMLVFGIYLYARHWRLARTKMILAALVAGSILASLGGAVSLTILIPFIYILVAAGIGFLLDRWQKVFPRNAIAQSVSVSLVSIAVVIASWYGLRHYFIAWPNASATKQVFTTE